MPFTARETKGQSLLRTPVGNVSASVVAGSDRIEEYHAADALAPSGQAAARWATRSAPLGQFVTCARTEEATLRKSY